MSNRNMIFPIKISIEEKLPYYLTGVGANYEQEDVIRPNGFPKYQWIQCREGSGWLYMQDRRYEMGEGQGLLLFPGEPHSYHAVGRAWRTDWIMFDGDGVERFFRETMGAEGSQLYYVSDPVRLSEKIEEIYEASAERPVSAPRCSALIYETLLDIMTLTSTTARASIDEKFKKLGPVMTYINENVSHPIQLEELAKLAGVTPQYLCVIFKKFTSRTVFEYINLVRVRRSKELFIENPRLTVKDAAYMAGFTDVSYFCSIFKRFEGMSPSKFREKM